MKLLKNIVIYTFMLLLIILAFNYRDTLLQLYDWAQSQSDIVSKLIEIINQIFVLFQ